MFNQKKLDPQGVLYHTDFAIDKYRASSLENEITYLRHIRNYLPKGGVLYDIGACIGGVGLNFCRSAGKVIFLEPDPAIFQRLCHNIILNQFTNTLAFQMAFGSKTENIILYSSAVNTISPSTNFRNNSIQIEVQATSLEDLMVISKTVPDVVKVDIEGDEIHLIGQLEKIHPVLFIEIHPYFILDRERKQGELRDYLEQKGYSLVYENDRRKQVLTIWR